MINEHQQTLVTGTEQLRPALQAVDVFPCRPAFPHPPWSVARPARKAPAFDVHQQPNTAFIVNDKIQTLDTQVADHAAARFVDRYITAPVALQVSLERGLI